MFLSAAARFQRVRWSTHECKMFRAMRWCRACLPQAELLKPAVHVAGPHRCRGSGLRFGFEFRRPGIDAGRRSLNRVTDPRTATAVTYDFFHSDLTLHSELYRTERGAKAMPSEGAGGRINAIDGASSSLL